MDTSEKLQAADLENRKIIKARIVWASVLGFEIDLGLPLEVFSAASRSGRGKGSDRGGGGISNSFN